MEHSENGDLGKSTVDVREYLYVLWSWAWLIVLVGLLAGAAAYAVSVRMTPIYEASTKLLVSAPSAISGVDPTALVAGQTVTSTYSAMLLDRPVLQGVIDQLQLDTTPAALKKSISVESVTNTQLLEITVQDPDPQRAADVANAMASVFASRIRQLQSQRYSASREGLTAQIADMEQQITTTTGQIAAIQLQVDAIATQAAIAATQTKAAAAQTRTPATQTAVAALQTTPLAPPVLGVPDTSALTQLQARLTQYRTIYSTLVTSYEQVRLSEEQTSTNVVVSEEAVAGAEPVRPKTRLNMVVSALAGMLLAALTVLAAERLDDTIKNPEELRRKFNIPILGMIAWHQAAEKKPIALAEPRSPTAEAFRSLRTNITYAAVDRPLRRLMITSSTPEEGKTTVASNVAVVFSQNEQLVLLLDADMRRPAVHRKFGLDNRIGLSDLFVRPREAMDTVIQASVIRKLAVMTSGGLAPNPSELLSSKMMGHILDKLNEIFDLVVIDTPPVLSVTDASALAATMDGVVLVAKPGTTKVKAFQQALEQLRAVNARVLGVVLNEVDPGSRRYGYYYNGYDSKYSRYYATSGGKQGKARRTAKVASTGAAAAPEGPIATNAPQP